LKEAIDGCYKVSKRIGLSDQKVSAETLPDQLFGNGEKRIKILLFCWDLLQRCGFRSKPEDYSKKNSPLSLLSLSLSLSLSQSHTLTRTYTHTHTYILTLPLSLHRIRESTVTLQIQFLMTKYEGNTVIRQQLISLLWLWPH